MRKFKRAAAAPCTGAAVMHFCSWEVQSHLYYVALDQRYVSEKDFGMLYEQVKKTKSLIDGFIAYLKGKR